MTHHAPLTSDPTAADAGRQIAQLREVLRLIDRIAERGAPRNVDPLLDEAARLSDAYDRAVPVVQRRFDALAAESAAWAAAGVEALLASGGSKPPRFAALRLADRLERALDELGELLVA